MASAWTAEICSCQSEWQAKEEQIKTLQEEATKACQSTVLWRSAYYNVEHIEMDGPPDEGPFTSNTGMPDMG
jgi:hypothetical protein